MINEAVLSEKLKYLVMMDTRGKFEILDFGVAIVESDGKIERYEVNMECDYLGVIDPDIGSFIFFVKKAIQILEDVLSEHTISSEGKLVRGSSSNAIVSESSIWKFDYVADSKHLFDLSFIIQYVQ
jgi:hypothetical protein